MLFEGVAGALEAQVDHVHSTEWFSETNVHHGIVFDEVSREVAVDRHLSTAANYLYADGHVATVSASQIAEWCDEGKDFARPAK
nr:hypothetical protein [Pseudobythopirellula maris]